jgi:predicted transcriptional regulator
LDQERISLKDILRSIVDDKSLLLINTIAALEQDSRSLKDIGQLTEKQYYSRLSNLLKCGLITRYRGKYYLSSFGKVVCAVIQEIASAIDYFYQVKTLDSINEANQKEFKEVDSYSKLIDSFIHDVKIKEFLLAVHSISH